MSVKQYFVFDGTRCKAESLTKEQIINLIAEATGVTPTDPDEGFISTIKETNKNKSIHVWKGTQAEYNALATHDADTFYIIDDDARLDDIESELAALGVQQIGLGDRVTTLETDTGGWINIERQDRTAVEQIIGKFRQIGKMIFCQIEYGLPDFSSVCQDIFSVPFDLTINNTTNPKIPFFYTTHDSQYYYHCGVAEVNKSTGNSSTIHIWTKETSGVEFIYITFCLPIE